MPTLRSHSVGVRFTSPSPGAASTSPGGRPARKTRSSAPAAVDVVAPSTQHAFSLDPVTPAGQREHARSTGRPTMGTKVVSRTRQSRGKKKLLFAEQEEEQQQRDDEAEEDEEPVGRRRQSGRKRVRGRRGGGGAIVGEEAVATMAAREAAVASALERADDAMTAKKGKRKFGEASLDDGGAEEEEEGDDEIPARDVDCSDSDDEQKLGRNGPTLEGPGGTSTRGGATSSRPARQRAPEEPNRRAEATKAKFLEIARSRAAHFAHYTGEEQKAVGGSASVINDNGNAEPPGDVQNSLAAELLARVSADIGHRPDNADEQNQWPGPFVIARQLVEGREAAAVARQEGTRSSDPNTKCSVNWAPSRRPGFRKERIAPSLHNMCVEVLCANIDHVTSLVGVPDAVKKAVCNRLCARRIMTESALRLYVSSEPSELVLPDGTFVTEEILTEALANCSTKKLEVLELGLCGRGLSDQLCTSTLVGFSRSLPLLHTLVLNGAYRLTDSGLTALVQAAPNLITLSLKQCSMISATGLEAVADASGGTLKTISLESCGQLDGLKVVSPLMKMGNLESLCLSGLSVVSNGIMCELAVNLGPRLRELFIADCKCLTDAAVGAIGLCCPELQLLDMGHLPALTDTAIGVLADGCRALKTLRLDRGKFSDASLASLVTASGNCLAALSLNSVRLAGDLTVSALAKHSKVALERLDLSFCREVSDQALGLLADSCGGLHEIRLFGCTQVTNLFLEGHSNPVLNVIGLPYPVKDVSPAHVLPPRKVVAQC